LFNGFLKVPSKPECRRLKIDPFPNPRRFRHQRRDSLEVIFYRDAKVDDGRYANNGWMQELARSHHQDDLGQRRAHQPQNGARTRRAKRRHGRNFVERPQVKGPIWTQPGMADYSLGLALGYGREKAGRVGTGVGFNAYKIFNGKYIETGATVRKTGETHMLACTQHHWSMEGRPAVREANLRGISRNRRFREEKFHGVEPPVVRRCIRIRSTRRRRRRLHQWGMAVDLTRASAAAPAWSPARARTTFRLSARTRCLRGREMHWMRD
jgi:hypothetical protein